MRFLKDLAVSGVMCVAERLLERIALPGLHRAAGRMVATDPSRADDVAIFLAEVFALFALAWAFNGALYAIAWLSRRPLKPQAVTLVTGALLVLIFLSSAVEYAQFPATSAQ
jgi:hypothetical protein